MTTISNLGSTGIYAYTTLISVFICVPGIFFFEPGVWAAIREQVAIRGAANFYGSLLSVGLLYHLYNQFAFNTLSRITPVSHGVCNVVKRVVIIATSGAMGSINCGAQNPRQQLLCTWYNTSFDALLMHHFFAFSVLFFGNKLTAQTKMGTAVALLGTYAYTEAVKRYKAPAKPKTA